MTATTSSSLWRGAHAGKVLTGEMGRGFYKGNFEYAAEIFPYWQSNTPKFDRRSCQPTANPLAINCSPFYTVGGTFHGINADTNHLALEFYQRASVNAVGAGGGWRAVDEP